jgi:hypothetical protein
MTNEQNDDPTKNITPEQRVVWERQMMEVYKFLLEHRAERFRKLGIEDPLFTAEKQRINSDESYTEEYRRAELKRVTLFFLGEYPSDRLLDTAEQLPEVTLVPEKRKARITRAGKGGSRIRKSEGQ